MTTLTEIQAGWDQAARTDAQGNIISIPGLSYDEFMERGRREIAEALQDVAHQGLKHGYKRALDFGCGIGRLTVALAEHFEHVLGVDISAEMIARGVKHRRVIYAHSTSLAAFDPPFDFIYSNITFQHMPTELQEGYVRDFVRLLAPDGVAVFSITDCQDFRNGHLSMYGTPVATVEAWVTAEGGQVLTAEPRMEAAYTTRRYTVTR